MSEIELFRENGGIRSIRFQAIVILDTTIVFPVFWVYVCYIPDNIFL